MIEIDAGKHNRHHARFRRIAMGDVPAVPRGAFADVWRER